MHVLDILMRHAREGTLQVSHIESAVRNTAQVSRKDLKRALIALADHAPWRVLRAFDRSPIVQRYLGNEIDELRSHVARGILVMPSTTRLTHELLCGVPLLTSDERLALAMRLTFEDKDQVCRLEVRFVVETIVQLRDEQLTRPLMLRLKQAITSATARHFGSFVWRTFDEAVGTAPAKSAKPDHLLAAS